MKILLFNSGIVSIFLLGIFLVSNVYGQFEPTIANETRASTWYFSIQPLDNWAYQNAGYAPDNMLGWNPNNAVDMFPNTFLNNSIVYGMIAQDAYYTMKNTKLDHYVNYKMNNPNLKYIEGSELLSKEENDLINGTKTLKLIYNDPNSIYKLVLYLTQHNNDNYVMYYRADKDYFDKYLPEFEQMVKSIKWIE